MLVFREKVDFKIEYPLDLISSKEKIIFFDIETTGFSRDKSFIYLIGCMYYIGDTLMYTQWLAENKNDEANVLMAFQKFIQPFDTVIHFNGNSFDIPFVIARGEKIRLDFNFDSMNSIDIYKPVSKLGHLFNLENKRQKSFEKLLSINRVDPFTGGELIELYFEYLRRKDEKLLLPLLMHNKEDVWNMGKLISLLSIPDLFSGKYHVNDFKIRTFIGKDSKEESELQIMLTPYASIPTHISYGLDGIYLLAEDKRVSITIGEYMGELKYFFENYKDYYYLPLEDRAIHKSIASFVDSKYRKQATKSTCYEKKTGSYLPLFLPTKDFNRVFKKEHSDKISYIESKDINKDNIKLYIQNLFDYLLNKPKK